VLLDERTTRTARPADSLPRQRVRPGDWLLSRTERDNPHSDIDRYSAGADQAWTAGNTVRPIVHGHDYFRELLTRVRGLRAGDLLLCAAWRADADELLAGPGTELATVLGEAAARGVVVKALVWRSHLGVLQFSQRQNRELSALVEAAGGQSLLDTRVRVGGCHHQKFVVLRHRGRPELDIAFLGGIDLCHGRKDDHAHRGDPQALSMAAEYGPRPPWHDVQIAITGPAVAAVEAVFRERWADATPATRNPFRRIHDTFVGLPPVGDPLPAQLPAPPPGGQHTVQLLRTYPYRRPAYPFAPRGERSVARGYRKAIARARELIYLEDQYLWSSEVAEVFAEALVANPGLRLIAVVPRFPDQSNILTRLPQLLGRARALEVMRAVAGDRVAAYSPENATGTPVFVHAKVCIVDDTWAAVGSDNLNLRSWTYDSELTCAVIDGSGRYARDLRERLGREHLGRSPADRAPIEAADMFDAVARSAARLDDWYANGQVGPRPPGRLRAYEPPGLHPLTRLWATPIYRFICDPDARPRALRRRREF
jgi:phosphatidylserine/phosphatidylglycerophosphate/cardiolipin synthase-like enzyme